MWCVSGCVNGVCRGQNCRFILLFFVEFSAAIQAATIAGPFRIFTMPRRVIPTPNSPKSSLPLSFSICTYSQQLPDDTCRFGFWLSPVARN